MAHKYWNFAYSFSMLLISSFLSAFGVVACLPYLALFFGSIACGFLYFTVRSFICINEL